MVSPITCRAASSTNGIAQPPWVNPFLGSSSGPPGPCMTPSTVSWVIEMIFRIVSLQGLRLPTATDTASVGCPPQARVRRDQPGRRDGEQIVVSVRRRPVSVPARVEASVRLLQPFEAQGGEGEVGSWRGALFADGQIET